MRERVREKEKEKERSSSPTAQGSSLPAKKRVSEREGKRGREGDRERETERYRERKRDVQQPYFPGQQPASDTHT